MSWITRMLVTGCNRRSFGNIQDAIAGFLSVVNELTQESETRYVEVARDAKTFGSISQKSD